MTRILSIAALLTALLSLRPHRAEATCVVQSDTRYCFPPGTDDHVWEGHVGEDYNFVGDALSQMIVWYDVTTGQCGDVDYIGDGSGLTMWTVLQDAGNSSQVGQTWLGTVQSSGYQLCGQELRAPSMGGYGLNFTSYFADDTIVSATSTDSYVDCTQNASGSCDVWIWNDGLVNGSNGSDMIVRMGGSGNSMTYAWDGDDFIYNWSGQSLSVVYCGNGNDTFDGPYSYPPNSCETIL